MLIADFRFGEGMREVKPRAAFHRFQTDRHARGARRNRLAALVAVGEDDALWLGDLDHFAQHLDAVRIAYEHAAAGPRVDGGPGAPPRGPAAGISEEPEDSGPGSFNDECAFKQVR